MLDAPGLLDTLFAFAIALGLLVFIHEWGHYYAAHLLGVRAEKFSIGMGPELLGWTDRRGTRWCLSALPLGGYVKFYGDADPSSRPDAEQLAAMAPDERRNCFHGQPLWRRAVIIAAGPAVNFLFAIMIFAGMFMFLGKQITPAIAPSVVEGGAADRAGIMAGDRIVKAAGRRIDSFEGLVQEIRIRPEIPFEIVIERNGEARTLEVVPDTVSQVDLFGNTHTYGQLGIPIPQMRESQRLDPLTATGAAIRQTGHTVRLMLEGLRQILLGLRPLDDLGGPIKIAKISGEQMALGSTAFITFLAIISINLGLVNLFPIPILDGGHLLFYAIEAVRGRPLSERLQEWGYAAGLTLVLGLMVVLTFNDLVDL